MHRTAALPLFTTMLDCGRRLIILPLAIQIGGWIYYFAALQTALSG